MYPHPFSAGYWRDASREVRDLRKLLFSALMIALCIVLAQVPSVPLFGGAKVTWGFLARSVCAWVCGPVLGLLFAFAEDILSFFLTGGGGYPFFPGYTLTTMLGVLTYALFLYRAPLRIWRVFCAKLLTNVQNVVLGALWIAILNSNGRFSLEAWYASASLSAVKNLIMLPVQTVLLVVLLRALQPALQRTGMLPRQGAGPGRTERTGHHVRRKTGRGRRPVFDLRSRGKCSKIRWHLFTICLYPSVDNGGAWW